MYKHCKRMPQHVNLFEQNRMQNRKKESKFEIVSEIESAHLLMIVYRIETVMFSPLFKTFSDQRRTFLKGCNLILRHDRFTHALGFGKQWDSKIRKILNFFYVPPFIKIKCFEENGWIFIINRFLSLFINGFAIHSINIFFLISFFGFIQ